jgi:hypothetical protein
MKNNVGNDYKSRPYNFVLLRQSRTSNAAEELFNAKIKAFRAQYRGARNVVFFFLK